MACLFLLTATSARAEIWDVCKYLKEGGPAGCNGFKVSSGGSVPSSGSTHRMNPASIPTNAPWGVEVIASVSRQPEAYMAVQGASTATLYNFSVVRGFKRLGAGVSTDGEDTFFTHSYVHAAKDTFREAEIQNIHDEYDSLIRTLNVGTAFAIPTGNLSKLVNPSLGVQMRYNIPMQQWGWGAGVSLSSQIFSAGISYNVDPNEYEDAKIGQLITMVGFGYGPFRLDYSILNYKAGDLKDLPASVVTASLNWKRVIVFGGRREAFNFQEEVKVDYLYGVQLLVWSHLSIGGMYNYLSDRVSYGAQIFL